MNSLPCIVFEDEHLLIVNKPAGWNTHAPSPFAGEGLYEWLKHREPRWATLAIIHRLDKETSGLIVFSKSPLGNKSLHDQFASRSVRKLYWFATDHPFTGERTARTSIRRSGEKYLSQPVVRGGEVAETRFKRSHTPPGLEGVLPEPTCWLQAEPFTGRTHQIRVHAAELGVPILGDTLYGGTAASRLWLHAASIRFQHPARDLEMAFTAELRVDNARSLREAIIDPFQTNACRIVHSASDRMPGIYLDRFGPYVLAQSERPLSSAELDMVRSYQPLGVYHKTLLKEAGKSKVEQASPVHLAGYTAPDEFVIQENGLRYQISFKEGYSVGLFLDQRDNRRRLLTGHVGAGFDLEAHSPKPLSLLNTFAYTCGFSVAAAKAGMHTTSLDLSRKYLDWGRRNMQLNGIDPAQHDFIYGDVFDWMKRLAKRSRQFDLVILDPPTFSRSKVSGTFHAEKDYGKLIGLALRVLNKPGVLLASTNAGQWTPEEFMAQLHRAFKAEGARVAKELYFPQPPDFPVSRAEPAYLKTVWFQVE